MRFTFLPFTFLSSMLLAQTPQEVAPGIISDGKVFGFTLSPDGHEAFWVKSNGGRDTMYIMTSTKVKGEWQQAMPAPFTAKPGAWKDIDPMFSPDGKTILFQSTRPVEGKPNRKGFDIWAVKKTKKGWSEAYHLGNDINTDASESFTSITKSGDIYFTKENSEGKAFGDLYVSRFVNEKYQSHENLGAPINSILRESNPFISPDEDFIIFASGDSTGANSELVISFRENGRWTPPKNLGKVINSDLSEFCPFYHAKEKRIYFSRTVLVPGGRRKENIFSYPIDINSYR